MRPAGRHYVVPNDSVGIADTSSEVGKIVSSLDGLSVTRNV